ncbi:prephenate dehydrogenase/arogenate dehydrogenase family protein [Pseudomonas sp. LS1212]|uniref:prephenate dehydrogenase dimerization domain-containing protein n=1 Tax=Pseudomonas sp. LS1212 TaxID=2972478 RepID=UPI00215B923F|nr:prephenate dehydrogenase dimerization domain-containing protein [Pseudomonas sp. LS1212]UVJ42091.1 prephenate dehydrogenase/arogenate dehydrogenase family protein [Pseudomonas sp. LS1212]
MSEAGMSLRRMAVKQHDQTMAPCQALPHAAVIAFGMALVKSGANLETLFDVAPPPMRTMMALLSRILSNPMEVYWDIQYENPYAAEQRDVLVEALTQLRGWMHNNDQKAFSNQLIDVAQQLGAHRASGASECQRLFSLLNEFGPGNNRTRQND